MASTYSTNLALELMGDGDQPTTWGQTTNTNLGTLIEQAISGYVTQAITDGADTTITIPNGASGVARNMYIELTGALTAARNLVVPSNKKLYFIYNNTTGGHAVTVKVSGGTGVSVANGAKVVLVSNGTDIVNALSTGALTAIDGVPIGAVTPSTGAFTTLSATSTVSGAGFTARFASPGPIGNTSASTGAFTTLSATSTVSGAGFTARFSTPGPIGNTTPSSGAFTTLSASSTVSGAGFTSLFAAPPAIGGTTPSTGAFTTLSGTTLSVSSTVSGTGFTNLFASPPAIGTTTPAGGRFTFAHTAPVAVTFSATAMAVNCALSNVFTTTFTANVTTAPSFSNLKDGQTINWFITQDATGSRTMTWPTSFKWPGGTAGVLSTAANAVDLLTATYRAATGFWYCSLEKNFS